jgi:hypothetical protein
MPSSECKICALLLDRVAETIKEHLKAVADYEEAVRSDPENASPFELRLVRARHRRWTALGEYRDHHLIPHSDVKTMTAGAE